MTNDLRKSMSLKLGAQAAYQIVVVMKSPKTRSSEHLVNKLNIKLLTYASERFGIDQSFEESLKKNYSGSMKNFFTERRSLGQI